MADVFISYKSERRPAARHLAKILQMHGFSAWYDHGLLPGEDFDARLMAEVEEAQVVVALWCARSVASPWVLKETTAARAAGKLLPCRIEQATPPPPFDRDDIVDLTGWDGAPRSHALDRLLLDLGRRLDRDPAPQFAALAELDQDWRDHGAQSLAQFQLVPTPQPPSDGAPLAQPAAQAESWPAGGVIGAPPPSLYQGCYEKWRKADEGDADAQYSLANGFVWGLGIDTKEISEHDRNELSARLCRLAAEQGHADAQKALGLALSEGRGVERNDLEAVKYYRLAVDQGHAEAQINLGWMYCEGRGVEQDYVEAARLYRLAADQGDPLAKANLASLFENGHGVRKSRTKAIRLYREAADGNVSSGEEGLERLGATRRGLWAHFLGRDE